ncbi:MAG: ATP-dependent helicase [Gammaproteobacteria bacterium]|nr:MAG: ATP-dependent helicase [Gammaproteobacteria bacterium]RLA14593.1 MAG: ATP-dependent helicase [Gammaproteobacteria bacterium]
MSFASLGLSEPLLKAVAEQDYDTPTPIQLQAIPAVLEGRDVMAAAQTGTGKTAGFVLPILQQLAAGERAKPNHIRVLILTPTRELAAQVQESVVVYGKHLSLSSAVVFGGVKINPQMMKLRRGVDVLVATPGRLLDLFGQNAVKFDDVEVLVLDEADRMLDMGFIHDIKKILGHLPKQRQNLMFSATFSADIRKLAKGLVNDPLEISVSPRNTTVETVEHWIHPVDKKQKAALLIHLIEENSWHQALIFSRTKHGANKLVTQLEKAGIQAAAIHGNKSQGARTRALAGFKDGKVRILVATDIAARGIDIDQLPQVVNFDLPNVPEDYVHRIGRTGRAGSNGQAVSLVCADEVRMLSDIEHLIGQLLPRKFIGGFEPEHNLPETTLDRRPPKPPTPKKEPRGRRGGHRDGQRSGENSRGHRAGGQARAGQKSTGKPGRSRSTSGSSRDNSQGGQPSKSNNRSANSGDSSGSRRSGNSGSESAGNVAPRGRQDRPDNWGNR